MTFAAGIPARLVSAGWDADELREVRSIAAEIDSFPAARRRSIQQPALELALSDAMRFSEGMSSTFRALIVRQLLAKLGFDEHRVFRWRLEHKLVQAAFLHHYDPDSIPVTRGLRRFISQAGGDSRCAIEEAFPAGYVVKRALGDTSGERGLTDRTEEVLASLPSNGDSVLPTRLCGEHWVLQQRIPIKKEYRVHSIEDRVISDMTFHRFGSGNIPGEREAPNCFVERLLRKLPDGVVGGSLLAWDIALTPCGDLVVIEVNFSGYHPVWRPGFQCSGFYQDVRWGASMIARLLRFVENVDDVSINLRIDLEEASCERDFFAEVSRWHKLFRNGEYE
jgi:hypothetical protein